MVKILWAALMASILSACSIYKSNVRKEFESNSPDYIQTSATAQCETLGTLPAWFEKEFSGGGAELLIADNELEVWKKKRSDGRVVVQSFRSTSKGTESCRQEFPNESAWETSGPAYLNQLDAKVTE